VLAHELGHSFVALRQGIEVKSITLFIFGGLAALGEESKTPGDAFKVAIAGPLVSFALCGILAGLWFYGNFSEPLTRIVGLLAYINLMLGTFNLIPGLPLDGGNVLKAIVWKITGKPYKGVAFASRVGQVFGWAGVLVGVAFILDITSFGSVWTLLIGWFLLRNAGLSIQSARVQEQLSDRTAADAIIPNSPVIAAHYSLREFANTYIIGSDIKWQKFLVTDDQGKLIGEVSVEDLKTVPTNEWWDVQVSALTKPLQQVSTIAADKPLLEVIRLLDEQSSPTLAVVQSDGVVLGLLEKNSILQLLQPVSTT
jgi:Zn-dependent protease/CBS domain-containing protein